MSNKPCLSIDEAAQIFKKVVDKNLTFDSEEDKTDFLLDMVIEYKKEANKLNI